eukprot:3331751-Pyramimonas_sp.AAC.1
MRSTLRTRTACSGFCPRRGCHHRSNNSSGVLAPGKWGVGAASVGLTGRSCGSACRSKAAMSLVSAFESDGAQASAR